MDLRREKMEEMGFDAYMEEKLRYDYDAFCDYHLDEFQELGEAITKVKRLYSLYEWEFDLLDVINHSEDVI